MPRFIPMNPVLQRMAPGMQSAGMPVLPGGAPQEFPVSRAEQAIPGENVPMPEPVQLRGLQPRRMPPSMNDTMGPEQQALDFNDVLRENLGPGVETPFYPNPQTPGRPMNMFENMELDRMNEMEPEFAQFAPQVDASYGIASLRRRIKPNLAYA